MDGPQEVPQAPLDPIEAIKKKEMDSLAEEVKKEIPGKPFDVRSMFTISINIRKKPGEYRKYDVYYWTEGGKKFDSQKKIINSLKNSLRKSRKVDAS